jgi:hypothetical protein
MRLNRFWLFALAVFFAVGAMANAPVIAANKEKQQTKSSC